MDKDQPFSKNLISKVMSEMGRKGGEKKVPKGLAAMTPERRAEIRELGRKARAKKRSLSNRAKKEK